MVFTAAQTTAFFENATQMHLPHAHRVRLAGEGLTSVDDFADFQADELKIAVKNLRNAIPGPPAVPPCLISAKCCLRLKVASHAYHYYQDIGREHTPANMNYRSVLKGFNIEREAIEKLIEEAKPEVPVLSRNVPPLKWLESFRDCLLHTFGVRGCPLSYIVREVVDRPDEADDPLVAGKAYGSSGSILEEMIARFSHDHPLYRSDNQSVYSMLETATRGTPYASTVKAFSRTKDGRRAWESMVSSHAGIDKWEKLEKEKTAFMRNTKWNGRTYSLDKFCGLHRSAFVALEEAKLHVNFQLPTEHTRVQHLLDNITHPDPDLRAALGNIRLDQNGMRSDFESAVTHLLPVCPYAKSRANSNKHNPGANVSGVTLKGAGDSKTGVDLRWHSTKEYKKLTKDQKQELFQWQQTKEGKAELKKRKSENGGDDGGNSDKKAKFKAQVNALSTKLDSLEKTLASTQEKEEVASIAAAIAANQPQVTNQSKPAQRSVTIQDPYQAAALAVQKIVKRGRGESKDADE